MLAVQVNNRVLGAAPQEIILPPVQVEFADEQIRVEELIERTVTEQITLMLAQQTEDSHIRHALNRQYLTHAEVAEQAARGQVMMPRQSSCINQAREIERAKHAFSNRAYVIMVDGHQPASLDEVVTLQPTSKITFLRLTPLVGG